MLDDRAARECASAFGLKRYGTIGVLVRAKRAGLISALAPLLAAVRAAGLHMDTRLEAQALALAGE